MFHTILFLSYTIPNIYVFLRIRKLFINKEYRLIYALIYLIISLIYPISNFFFDGEAGLAARIVTGAANYILPFYLYLFLFILVYDIFLLVNLLFRFIPATKMKTTKYRKTLLILIVSLSAAVVAGGVINFNTIRTSEYSIEVPGKLSHIKNLRIAFVSDFHLKEGTDIRFVEKFIEKVDSIKPDLMLFGGDIVEGDRESEDMYRFEKLLGGIKTKYGVYGVLGNHEHYTRQDKRSFFRKAGIEILSDTVIVIDNSFNLAGRNDSHISTRKKIDALLRAIADSLPVILVDHRPSEIEQISKTSADVVFSGHTHNGQLFPIDLITRRVYELSHGYMKKGETHFFVSSGIRLWGPPVRTTGKSEIMVVDINLVNLGLKRDFLNKD
jgi:predicted MPP superfamily phosphohydrolase